MIGDEELLGWISYDANRLADVCDGHGDVVVPSCPGWVIEDLVAHIAPFFAGWYTFNLSHDPSTPDPGAAFGSAPVLPDDHGARIRYLRDGVATFVEAASTADLNAEVWGFDRAEPARYWVWRAATETLVHLWDAASARGVESGIDPIRAAFVVDETVRGIWTRTLLVKPVPKRPDEPLMLHDTTTGHRWLATCDDSGRVVITDEASSAECSVSASGLDLTLWVWGHVTTASMNVTGDPSIIDEWNLVPRLGV